MPIGLIWADKSFFMTESWNVRFARMIEGYDYAVTGQHGFADVRLLSKRRTGC